MTKTQNTYVFIDASNIIYGATRSGWKVDFEKLFSYLISHYKASKVIYYAGLDSENLKQITFYEKLGQFGYELRLVPVKKFADGSKKADCDARLTFEAMRDLTEYGCAIFMTGDGDYFWLFEYLLEEKGHITLLAHPKSTARELRRLFGYKFQNIEDIKNQIERREEKRSGSS